MDATGLARRRTRNRYTAWGLLEVWGGKRAQDGGSPFQMTARLLHATRFGPGSVFVGGVAGQRTP